MHHITRSASEQSRTLSLPRLVGCGTCGRFALLLGERSPTVHVLTAPMLACPAAIALVEGEPVLVLDESVDPALAESLMRLLSNIDARCAIPVCGG